MTSSPSGSSQAPFLNASTRYIAILGDPIGHSMTPVLQNAALCELEVNVRNIALRVSPADLPAVVTGARAAGFLGLMVTIPHKVAALGLVDQIDSFGKLIGSLNLIHFNGEGVLGYNTDGYAASRSLGEQGIVLKDARIALLGAGGAGRCLAYKFALEGAAALTVLNRTEARGAALAAEVCQHTGVPVTALPLTDDVLAQALSESTLLVNTTSVGMHPAEEESPVPAELLRPDLAVYDIVYNPLETKLLREAAAVGARTADGVGMLVYTNERAVQVCVGRDPSVETMMDSCLEALRARQG